MILLFFSQARVYVENFRSTTESTTENTTELVCQCPTWKRGVQGCEGGKTLLVQLGYWAGSLKNNNIPEPPEQKKEFTLTSEKFEEWMSSSPWSDFDVAPCENGKCLQQAEKLTWNLAQDSPCIASLKTTGPLCGICKNRTSLIIASRVSEVMKGLCHVVVNSKSCACLNKIG